MRLSCRTKNWKCTFFIDLSSKIIINDFGCNFGKFEWPKCVFFVCLSSKMNGTTAEGEMWPACHEIWWIFFNFVWKLKVAPVDGSASKTQRKSERRSNCSRVNNFPLYLKSEIRQSTVRLKRYLVLNFVSANDKSCHAGMSVWKYLVDGVMRKVERPQKVITVLCFRFKSFVRLR